MSWIDDFGVVAGAMGSKPIARPSYTTWNTKLRSYGYQTDYGSSSLVNWSDLGSGSLGSSPLGSRPKPAAYKPAAPPERFDIRYPTSYRGPNAAAPAPPQSTEGDLFGSALGAVGNTLGQLNLANVVPFFMERVGVLADELSKSTVPIVGDVARVAAGPLDVFADGVIAASQFAAPILNSIPEAQRDSTLGGRARLYRAIVAGGDAPDVGVSLNAPTGWNNQYKLYRAMLLNAVDPDTRASIDQRMGMLREVIDLPTSAKVAIERNPTLSDDQIERLLSEAPEGRQWSYRPGPAGWQNMAMPLVFYLGEVAALGGVGRALRVAGAGSTIPGVAGATAGAGRALSVAAATQKYMMAAGLTLTPLLTTFDAVARYMGNEEAIAWFDRVNRTTKFSDDPSVQLVTSFSVNPFSAIKPAARALKAGVKATAKVATLPARVTIQFAKGLGGFTVKGETAARMERFAGNDGQMLDMIQRMYRLRSADEAETFIAENYEHRGQAFDEALGAALEEHVSRLPAAERAVIDRAFPDPIEYTRHVATTYADEAMDLLEKDAQGVAERWREKSWNYHGYAGRFSPELAAKNARDIRLVKERTYEVRAQQNAVVGYREAFPPQAQTLAKSQLDEIVLPDGTVPVDGLRGVDGLIENFPILRKHWTGLIRGDRFVPRATVDRILERATAEWQRVAKQNPVKARTGADPILRPNSPTLTRDTAEALGTNIETVNAIEQKAPTADALDAVRRFVVAKMDRTPEQVAAMPEDELVAAAQRYVEETTRPWRERGADVASAERGLATIRSDLAKLRAMPKGIVMPDEIIRLERQYAALNTLVRASADPVIPFVTEAAHARPAALRVARDIQLTELATRRAEATTRLRELAAIHDAGAVIAGDDWAHLFRQGPGGVQYSGGLPAMSAAMRRALRYSDHMGDYEAWSNLGNNLDQVEHLLTKAQRRRAHAVLDSGGWKHQGEDQVRANRALNASVGEGETTEDVIETLARLWAEREGVLAGTSEYALRRTAGMALPPQYVSLADEMAASGSVDRGVIQDPLFTTRTHPANVARLQDALADPDAFPAAREIIEADPVLSDRYAAFMQGEGLVARESDEALAWIDVDGERVNFTYDVLGDVAYSRMLADALIPADFVRPTPGVLVPDGLWDQAIMANDKAALEEIAQRLRGGEEPTFATKPKSRKPTWTVVDEPAKPVSVPARVARRAASRVPQHRPSVRYARRLAEADMTSSPDAAVMDALGNRIGLDVLSVMNHGIAGTRPATIGRLVELLRSIENGDARRAGIGDDLAAEAQRVANEILDAAVKDAPKPDTYGIFTKGQFPDDEMALAGEIEHLLTYDEANPLGTLQYGLKTRPKDAVVLELSKVPGLAEELMTGRFQPFEERVAGAQVRQAFNWVFGERSNATIRAESKVRFLERSAAQGVDGETASAIHDAWRAFAKESHPPVARKTPTGEFRFVHGDNPLYANIDNIPNSKLNQVAHQAIDELHGAGKIDVTDNYLATLKKIDYSVLFRESSSTLRRTLADNAGSLGRAIAGAYGLAAHNSFVTTYYYWFRFALDIRYQAQNYLEAQFLHLGRAGFRKGEIDQRPLLVTEEYVRNLGTDSMSNTGYPLSHDRVSWAYRSFLKERPDVLRRELRGLQAENEEMAQAAIAQLARHDPQIADMRRQFGDSPEKYLKELDAWHGKMLDSVSIDEIGTHVDEAMADAMRESPELAQVYARLGQAEKEHWEDIIGTFYGNPNRSRAERFLNSYLLFWPLSYQIKSTKWFAKVLFDRAGGLPTNAGGAYLFDQMATTHQRLLETDVEYQDWFEKHRTLVFVAQMMFPVSFDNVGVSLNPAMRSIFFERNKAFWDVGPIYTANHVVKPLAKELYADLYPTLKDVPGFDGIYRAMTGQQEPAPPKVAADVTPLERNP